MTQEQIRGKAADIMSVISFAGNAKTLISGQKFDVANLSKAIVGAKPFGDSNLNNALSAAHDRIEEHATKAAYTVVVIFASGKTSGEIVELRKLAVYTVKMYQFVHVC